jgi:acetyltransferase
MTIRNLSYLFDPKSVVVLVDKKHPGHYAEVLQLNLLAGGFSGTLMRAEVSRRSRLKLGPRVRIGKMQQTPELAVICTPLEMVAEIITQLGERGTRAVIVAPSTRDRLEADQAEQIRIAILKAARPFLIRVLGPGSGGLLVPAIGLNASVAPVPIVPGRIALICQSTAIASAILDHAASKGIGFSTVVHLGEGSDVDLADALNWLAQDLNTERILVQFDSVTAGRKFMSAARASGRNKPVVVIRSRKSSEAEGSRLPFSVDDVYEAAQSRSGWVQVSNLTEAFEATQALARLQPMQGEALSILANGQGLGSSAAAFLQRRGGRLAVLHEDTLQQIADLLRVRTRLSNPLELPHMVSPADWGRILELILADPATDALMTVYSPSPFATGTQVAEQIARVAQAGTHNIFSCWVGGDSVHPAKQVAMAHGVLSHDSPEHGVAVFMGLVNYYRNRELLMQTPPSLAEGFTTDLRQARAVVAEGLQEGARVLSSRLTRKLLQAFCIEAAEYQLAGSAAQAIELANAGGYPVDLALVLAGGVPFAAIKANLQSPADIHMAIRDLRQKARYMRPGIRVSGYRLRRSAPRSGIAPLSIGVATDPVFGPLIFLGPSAGTASRGGRFVVGLPPLNPVLALDMVRRSELAEDLGAAVRNELENSASLALVRLSQLLSDVDEVAGVELDPLHVETEGVIALEARITLASQRMRRQGSRRFAISPYPKELEQQIVWRGEKLLVRPIRPEDEDMLGCLLESLSVDDSRMRFFVAMRRHSHAQLARFTQIDYDREMSLVLVREQAGNVPQALGEARLIADADNQRAEFAMVVSSAFKGQGLGGLLMQQLLDYARWRGIGVLCAETLPENQHMLHVAQKFGFVVKPTDDPNTVSLELLLREADDGESAG